MNTLTGRKESAVSGSSYGTISPSETFLSDEQRFSGRILLVIDAFSGQILDASSQALTFYGYSAEQIASMKITEINTLPYFVVMKKRLDAAKKNTSSFIFPHRLADGRVKDVEVISKTQSARGRKYLLSEIKDISERALATG